MAPVSADTNPAQLAQILLGLTGQLGADLFDRMPDATESQRTECIGETMCLQVHFLHRILHQELVERSRWSEEAAGALLYQVVLGMYAGSGSEGQHLINQVANTLDREGQYIEVQPVLGSADDRRDAAFSFFLAGLKQRGVPVPDDRRFAEVMVAHLAAWATAKDGIQEVLDAVHAERGPRGAGMVALVVLVLLALAAWWWLA